MTFILKIICGILHENNRVKISCLGTSGEISRYLDNYRNLYYIIKLREN